MLILWADSRSANLGVRVLAEGTAALARAAWGEDVQVDYQDFGPGDSEVGFGGRTIVRDIGRSRGPIADKLSQYDVVIDTGAGDSFADIYGLKRLIIMSYAQRRSGRLGVPLVFGPQTIGPFSTRLGSALARGNLQRAETVFARDSISLDAARALGVDPVHSTDVVFALPQPRREAARDVVFNVSGLLWAGSPHVEPQRYRSAVVEMVGELQRRGRTVSLLAHVLDNPTADNDVAVLDQVADAVGGVETLVPTSLSAARAVIAGADLLIGSRMHACLNALSTGTPAVPWAYSRKFRPLLEDVGWEHTVELSNADDPVAQTWAHLDAIAADPAAVGRIRTEAESRLKRTAVLMAAATTGAAHDG